MIFWQVPYWFMVNIIKNFFASEARGETLLFLTLSLSLFLALCKFNTANPFLFDMVTHAHSQSVPLSTTSPPTSSWSSSFGYSFYLLHAFAALSFAQSAIPFHFLCSILFGCWRQLWVCSRVLAPYALCVCWRGGWESWGIDRSRVLKALPIVEYFTVFYWLYAGDYRKFVRLLLPLLLLLSLSHSLSMSLSLLWFLFCCFPFFSSFCCCCCSCVFFLINNDWAALFAGPVLMAPRSVNLSVSCSCYSCCCSSYC